MVTGMTIKNWTKRWIAAGAVAAGLGMLASPALAVETINDPPDHSDDVDLEETHGTLVDTTIIFEQVVAGTADGTDVPSYGFGNLNGAAVLGHVFPTTLNSSDIGFDADQGTVALAITAHPDFDDTPLVDEDGDGNPLNDGGLMHSHWVVVVPDGRVAGGLAVKALDPLDDTITKPDTHPGLPLFIDSPNFFVEAHDDTISVHVPVEAVNNRSDFQFGAVTAFLEVHGDAEPLLGVYVIYDILLDPSQPTNLAPFDIVPEPTSAAIAGLGLAGLAASRRRRG